MPINRYSANTLSIGNITTNNAASHYTCRFTRDLNVTKITKTKAGDTYTKTFDLEEGKKWNVFIAKGKMNKDVIQYHQSSALDGNTATFRRGFKFRNQTVQNTTVIDYTQVKMMLVKLKAMSERQNSLRNFRGLNNTH